MPQRQRPRRVAVRGARIQFANTPADVMNVSRTGALIRLGYHLRTGGEWPLVLELPAFEPVWLTGRVVRCRRINPSSESASPSGREYVLALRFIDPSVEAQAILDTVCGGIVRAHAAPVSPVPAARCRRLRPALMRLRRLSLSLRRRCPECGSDEVMKDVSHHYSCRQCGRQFAGFRVGPLRLSF